MSSVAFADDTFDLDALIEAAKAEAPIQVYDSTGKIVEMADNFTAKYGVEAVGTKVKAQAQLEMVIREAQAGNVQGDVTMISDAPAVMAQLVPQGFVTSWLSPDLKDKVAPRYQDPLVVVTMANVWAYNAELSDSCPVSNIWELTEPAWRGKVAMQDPLNKSVYTDWFNQMESHGDAAVAEAYEAYFGKPLETDEASATAAWIKAMAANGPLLGSSDSAAAEAVGAPGQTESFMGLMSSAKFRENADSGFKLGLCTSMKPWVGFTNAGVGMITAGTDSPNASKLFMHYVMTEEGIAPQSVDGKMSTNSDIKLPEDEPSGIGAVLDQVLAYDMSTALDDWDMRQDWQDFWRLSYTK
ncbi:ABC transporter substrate-binding protein [Mariluticola halotolerans]|uniref:ABC transporter substrate-binding protein n=1 Tax=Mariluticola halotolerans TaxID=2909283 RepID=UPI0026E245D8|nr:ABC transporter substrate-binding protein [Mariluticola halotolerans]UJQ96020.1 ABC transporter substrate-binding protein [Mariluticola halotolerans]